MKNKMDRMHMMIELKLSLMNKCSVNAVKMTLIPSKLATALYQELEPVEPKRIDAEFDEDGWWYGCGACEGAIDTKDAFCKHCGREIDWNQMINK